MWLLKIESEAGSVGVYVGHAMARWREIGLSGPNMSNRGCYCEFFG